MLLIGRATVMGNGMLRFLFLQPFKAFLYTVHSHMIHNHFLNHQAKALLYAQLSHFPIHHGLQDIGFDDFVCLIKRESVQTDGF